MREAEEMGVGERKSNETKEICETWRKRDGEGIGEVGLGVKKEGGETERRN